MNDLLQFLRIKDDVKQRAKHDVITKQVAKANVVSLVKCKEDK